VLSTQVLSEFYAVVTRRFVPPMPPAQAREIVGLYAEWPVVEVDAPAIMGASRLEERHGLSFWDALSVEAARRAGATPVLTEDRQSAPVIEGVRTEDPFG
jgi:predicted nucleic acid-binding protein